MVHHGRVSALLSALYIVLLVTAGMAGTQLVRFAPRRTPIATIIAFALTAVPSLLQLTVAPGLFEALRRDRTAIGDGELWRLVTSFTVQDGGWTGTIFNLFALAVIGTLAERRWGPARWVAIALAVQVLGNLWGLVVQPVGAGTSLVIFGLAGSLAASAVVARDVDRNTRAPAAVSLIAALTLLVLADIHGGAALLGAVAGAALTVPRRSNPVTPSR
jgi:rhomboid protease GluP